MEGEWSLCQYTAHAPQSPPAPASLHQNNNKTHVLLCSTQNILQTQWPLISPVSKRSILMTCDLGQCYQCCRSLFLWGLTDEFWSSLLLLSHMVGIRANTVVTGLSGNTEAYFGLVQSSPELRSLSLCKSLLKSIQSTNCTRFTSKHERFSPLSVNISL